MMATEPLPQPSVLALARALFKRPRPGQDAPCRTQYELAAIDPAHLARYNDLLGFGADALPVSYYYLLAQRAHLPTLLKPQFPFRVAGLVHAGNEIVEHRRAEPGVPMTLDTEVRIEPPRASGAVYCTLVTRACAATGPVFTCTSSYLAVRGAARGVRAGQQGATGPELGSWRLEKASGRAYAGVSGDWNPIHLWGWSARLFGMRAPVIHGMHTMARACALLEQADGRRVRALSGRFKAPAPLGATLALHASLAHGVYAVRAGQHVVLEGGYTFE